MVRAARWLIGGGLALAVLTATPAPDRPLASLPDLPVAPPSRIAVPPALHIAAFWRRHFTPHSRPDGAAVIVPAAPATATASSPVVPPPEDDAGLRELSDACANDACIDRYLWSLYQRAPKVDTIKVPEQIEVTVKEKGKTVTVAKTIARVMLEDFAWKDAAAAERAGMSLQDYVIAGMDVGFRRTLYRALRAMDDAGLAPGITSGFRDDFRQSIASGLKAVNDNSYHGGSRHGGYGHGLAADLVSVKGQTRAERLSSSRELWKWIDEHGAEFGIGRPYLGRDPPHVGPIDGAEYADHRGAKVAGLQTKPHANFVVKLHAIASANPHAGPRATQHAALAPERHARFEFKRRASLETRSHVRAEAKSDATSDLKKGHRPTVLERRPARHARTAKA